jgi:hypothetical protein
MLYAPNLPIKKYYLLRVKFLDLFYPKKIFIFWLTWLEENQQILIQTMILLIQISFSPCDFTL